MKKLPIGIQSFEKIRTENFYYVDKTHFVKKLVDEGNYYFLSRPRRFGKSLFLDTLKQAFLGKKELFTGLYLEKNWDWEKNYPVVHLDFGEGVIDSAKKLTKSINSKLNRIAQAYGIKLTEKLQENRFIELIEKLYKKFNTQVVVLIDEYDKPILDRIEDKEEAIKIREVLKNLYSVLKPLDRYLKFVFLTGVTKFSKVSLFSGLNQLNDITLDEAYSTICGYTQVELERVFGELINQEELEELKCWYNGYSWGGEPVYNPFDVLLYLQKRIFRPFWFETGTPTFLIKLLVEKKFYIPLLSNLVVTERLIESFDVDKIQPENLLFQSGYLTIKKIEKTESGPIYYLSYPNKEVAITLNDYLLSYLTQNESEPPRLIINLKLGLREGKVETLRESLKSLFAGIPYEWYRKNEISHYEGFYASVVYSFLFGAGFELIPEDITSKGKVDLTILYGGRCFLLEFKVVEMEGEGRALESLKEKGYAEKYKGKCSDIYLIGIEFSKERREITRFEWESV